MDECAYEPGDLVTLRGILNIRKPIPMVVKRAMQKEGYTSYEVRLLEDDLSDYRKGYTLTTVATESEIQEGKCRGPETGKWVLSPEKEAARAARISVRPSLAPVPVSAPALAPDFERFKEVVDSLLGELPEKTVREFAKTPEMALYTKVIKGGQTEEETRRFVDTVDTLLGELPQKTVEDFVRTPDYEVYKRVISAVKK